MAIAPNVPKRRPPRARGPKRTPATIWKLVDARCIQLADSVSATRIPFFLALTWTFIWAMALYIGDFGHLDLQKRLARDNYFETRDIDAWSAPSDHCKREFKDEAESLKVDPKSLGSADGASTLHQRTRNFNMYCKEIDKIYFEWVEKAWLDSRVVTLPGGFNKITFSDLGVVAQVGLSLILSWFFFAARRENHAIRAIVDFDENTRKVGLWRPPLFELHPQDENLSAEHVTYGYHSVAQRFVFLFSTHSRPLLMFTTTLCMLPAIVSMWNTVTDVRDFVHNGEHYIILFIKTAIEIMTVLLIMLLTFLIVRFEIDTSVLLNGWFLASRDVWMKDWDERTADTAQGVIVDVCQQKAIPIRGVRGLTRRSGAQ